MAVVTALRARGERVAVELDGGRWRTLPLEAVVRAGLAVGCELDRPRARVLARERRRLHALEVATRALRSRDRSGSELRRRLADRGVRSPAVTETVGTLERVGLVDDARFAAARARALVERGYGDAAVRHDLESRGVADEAVVEALATLAPEAERAVEHARRLGGGIRAARALARRGFGEDALEGLVAGIDSGELG
jgi:SOS response regulatory protein OraA/RecX